MEKLPTITTTSIITHPNFKSAIPYMNGASDINLFIGDVVKYQYMLKKTIPSSEINNWQREKEEKRLNSFKLKICEIDRLFMIERDNIITTTIRPLRHELYRRYRFTMKKLINHYYFVGRVNLNNEKLFYVYLNGSICDYYYPNANQKDAKGYIFISENVHVFLMHLNVDQHFKNSIYNFLLKTDNIVRFDNYDYYSFFLKERRFTLLNFCLEKMKNDRNYYKTLELPQNLQNFLDYKNLKDAIIEKEKIVPDYPHFELYLPEHCSELPHHYTEFCLICLDSGAQNHLINNDYYILEKSFHISGQKCDCSLCTMQNLEEVYFNDEEEEEDDYDDDDEIMNCEIPITIHQPNMERLCVELLETNYCENILNYQHLLQKRVPPSEMKNWENNNDSLNSFQIHPRDIDQLYYIWNDKHFYYPQYFHLLHRGHFIRVMGRIVTTNGKFLYFELVMWTLFNIQRCNVHHRNGFLFLSEDVSSFMYCIVEQYSEKHQKNILKKLLDDERTANKLFRYDVSKVEEMKTVYYYKKYNCIKNYLDNYTGLFSSFKYLCCSELNDDDDYFSSFSYNEKNHFKEMCLKVFSSNFINK